MYETIPIIITIIVLYRIPLSKKLNGTNKIAEPIIVFAIAAPFVKRALLDLVSV